jgi:hypothetical protein
MSSDLYTFIRIPKFLKDLKLAMLTGGSVSASPMLSQIWLFCTQKIFASIMGAVPTVKDTFFLRGYITVHGGGPPPADSFFSDNQQG